MTIIIGTMTGVTTQVVVPWLAVDAYGKSCELNVRWYNKKKVDV